MTVSRVRTSSIVQGFPKSRSLLAGNPSYAPPSFESIATSNPTSGTSITFSSIPSTYKHLQLRCISKFSYSGYTGTSALAIQYNGSSTDYTWHDLRGSGSQVNASGAATGSYPGHYAYAGMATNSSGYESYYAVSIIDIHDYASTTKNKTTRSFSGGDFNSTDGLISLDSSVWINTSAISSITITTDSGFGFVSGTNFSLYGIKG